MENLETYIAFDLEFNTVDGVSHIIQVSAVKIDQHEEVDQFDSFVYSDVPLQSFINGLTGITSFVGKWFGLGRAICFRCF